MGIMDVRALKDKADKYMIMHSGLEPDRDARYIGLSKVGWCPRLLYDRWFAAKDTVTPPPSRSAHLRCISGYMYESQMLQILVGAGIAEPRPWSKGEYPCDSKEQPYYEEIRVPFGTNEIPIIGHTDGKTRAEGALIEIKSFAPDQFRDLVMAHDHIIALQARWRNYRDQVQAYMRWGDRGNGYESCLFVAVARSGEDWRDPFNYLFLEIRRNDEIGLALENKLKTLIEAIARREQPKCECGRCGLPARVADQGSKSPIYPGQLNSVNGI